MALDNNKEYKVTSTQGTTVIDSRGIPVPGTLIQFSFTPNHIGQLMFTIDDINNGTAQTKIKEYIDSIRKLDEGRF